MNIVEAMSDGELFGPHFAPHPKRGDTWGPWQAFLKSWSGLGAEMTEAEAELYRQCTGRSALPERPFAETVLICGRRAGKSRVLAAISTFLAATADVERHLAAGETATIAILAADRAQAQVIFGYVRGLFEEVPLLRGMVREVQRESIVLDNRTAIEVKTASFRATRGYTYLAVCCDEAAFWQDESSGSRNPAEEIVRALRPGLATLPNTALLIASSPYAKRGILWRLHQRHHGRDEARTLVWQAPSLVMNPGLDPEIVAEAYAEDEQAARAEFGALFRDDVSDFLPAEVVAAAVVPGRYERQPAPVRHVAFADPSGGSGTDSFTLCIGHAEPSGRVVVDLLREHRPPLDPGSVVAQMAMDLARYGVSEVEGDRYAGLWPASRFLAHGIVYEPSKRTASEIYLDALPLFMSRQIEMLDHPRAVAQLGNLERRAGRAGRDSVGHPPGGHDDLANAVCGMALRATGGGAGAYDLFGMVGMRAA